jgi:hypothetical protein
MSKLRVALAIVSAVTFTTRLAAADDAPARKDRDAAFKLSAGATLVSVGLVVAGASTGHDALTDAGLLSSLVTPSAGELYAGKLMPPGLGLRAASAGIGLLGVNEALHCGFYIYPTGSCRNSGDITRALILIGAIGYVTGTFYDIATATSAVDEYNQRLHLRVTPTVIPTASAGSAVGLGLGLGGSF